MNMGTRATYEFRDELRGNQTFYIHWDGYPEGAATYFREMLRSPKGGSLAARFFRANPTAEFTQGCESHGDTDYHYMVERTDLRGLTVTAYLIKRNWETGDAGYNNIWRGSIEDFVAKFCDEDELCDQLEIA